MMKNETGNVDYPYTPPTVDELGLNPIFTSLGWDEVGETDWKESVYYWWWEYMKRNKEYGPGHPLWEDFGDINTDFREWWIAKGEYLFAEPRRMYTFKRVSEPISEEVYTDPNVMIVQVPLDQPVTELRQLFASYLDAFHTGDEPQQGIRAARSSQARYPVVGQPNVPALEKTLAVYDYRLKNNKMSLWEIWLALNPNMGRMIDPKCLTPEEVLDIPLTKASWTAAVSRYCKKAKAMIDNTGHGRFPDLSN
jgi:hypothetical protein